MTKEEIGKIWDANVPILNTENVLAFTRAIEAKVREECAVICEGLTGEADWFDAAEYQEGVLKCAEAIRARGEE